MNDDPLYRPNRHHVKPPTAARKRKGSTPEAKVAASIDRYLKKIGCISLRTSAGLITVDDRKISLGATGTSDRTCCIFGRFVAIEIKSATGKTTPAQEKYLDRVHANGGIAIVARSTQDVRDHLIIHFGLALVDRWEMGA
jgi:hypothetical protein